jgi:hypothetical protein
MHPDYPINQHRTYSLLHKPEEVRDSKENYTSLVCPMIKDFKLISSKRKECTYQEGTKIYKFRQV